MTDKKAIRAAKRKEERESPLYWTFFCMRAIIVFFAACAIGSLGMALYLGVFN